LRQIKSGLDIASKFDVREQALDVLCLVQEGQCFFRRSSRKRSLALILKEGLRKDADLGFVFGDENGGHGSPRLL
jgi:hypothetical protein